nr:hypothetical protein [uncultured Emticicia sp.]
MMKGFKCQSYNYFLLVQNASSVVLTDAADRFAQPTKSPCLSEVEGSGWFFPTKYRNLYTILKITRAE